MRRLAFTWVLLGAFGVPGVTAAVPQGRTILSFEVPVAPFSHTSPSFDCVSERTVSVASEPTSPIVKVVDVSDPMRWTARFDGTSLVVTTRSGLSGKMKVTYRDRSTLRAVADDGVAESLALDYRSGRGVFTTARNLPALDNELLARVHYLRCAPTVAK